MFITTQNLSIHHQKDLRPLVADLTLTINSGDKVAIIGEEGNGKSSLLKTLLNPDMVADYILMSGKMERHFSTPIYIPQSLPLEMAELTLNDYFFSQIDLDIDFGLLYRYADQLAFDSDRFSSDQLISSLSGGEKLKIQLIKSLAKDSDIVFLDEPSNDLDIDTLTWLETYIATSPKTIVYVSHDEDFLAKTATKIVHLQSVKKKILAKTSVQTIDYQAYRDQREEAYHKQVQQAQNERKEFEKAMEKHRRQKSQVRSTLLNTHDATAGRLVAKKIKGILAREKRYEKQEENMTKMPYHEDAIRLFFSDIKPLPAHKQIIDLQGEELWCHERLLVKNLFLQVKAGEKIGIIGANGVGKSTLIKLLYQHLQTRTDLQLGYMPQHYADLLPMDKTPLAFLAGEKDKEEQEIALTYLANLQFTREEVQHAISNLSGGQQAKLLLLKMVLDKANVLLLDEPSRNFSPTSQPYIRELFSDFQGTLICVSHDRRFLSQVCDRIVRLSPDGLEEIDNL